ncbi:hypothetical protein F4775DRAFT_273099 [Biscogniauxia sp. FL1348]|nr:hypothetical protein F4775DRAFT_273099 [Biscogniauxia sp. FL1348]
MNQVIGTYLLRYLLVYKNFPDIFARGASSLIPNPWDFKVGELSGSLLSLGGLCQTYIIITSWYLLTLPTYTCHLWLHSFFHHLFFLFTPLILFCLCAHCTHCTHCTTSHNHFHFHSPSTLPPPKSLTLRRHDHPPASIEVRALVSASRAESSHLSTDADQG